MGATAVLVILVVMGFVGIALCFAIFFAIIRRIRERRTGERSYVLRAATVVPLVCVTPPCLWFGPIIAMMMSGYAANAYWVALILICAGFLALIGYEAFSKVPAKRAR